MKILFAINSLGGIAGGAEKVLSIISSELSYRKHQILIVTFDNNQKPFYKFGNKVEFIDLEANKQNLPNKFFLSIFRCWILRKKILSIKPDIVVGFMHSIYILLAISLIGTGINLIASEHIVPEYYRKRKLQYFFINLASFLITRFTIVSHQAKNKFSYFIRRKMVVLPNPIVIPKLSSNNKYSKSDLQVLSIGRLTEQKDHSSLIKAFALVKNEFPEWKLTIIGEGPLRDDLEKLIKNLNIKDKVSLPGVTKNIEKFYLKSDIFIIPSKFESFGLVTAEAMSYALPVIGFSDCIGTNKLVTNDITGYLVQPEENRVLGLEKAMLKLMKSKSNRLKFGEAGSKKINLYYSTSTITDKWERFLKRNIK